MKFIVNIIASWPCLLWPLNTFYNLLEIERQRQALLPIITISSASQLKHINATVRQDMGTCCRLISYFLLYIWATFPPSYPQPSVWSSPPILSWLSVVMVVLLLFFGRIWAHEFVMCAI